MFHWSSPVLFFMGGFYRPSSTDYPPVSDLRIRTATQFLYIVFLLCLWVHDQRPSQTSKLGIHVGLREQITAIWFSSSAIVHEEPPPPTEPFPPELVHTR